MHDRSEGPRALCPRQRGRDRRRRLADDVQGDDVGVERLCYKVKCPKRALPAVQVTGSLRSRVVGVRRSRLLCLPVVADDTTP
jgi:hypothetical protein